MSIRKSIKGTKNTPFIHDEVKKNHNLAFTPTAWALLQAKAKEKGISVSEMIEQWIRETAG